MGADPVSQGTEVMIVTKYDCLVYFFSSDQITF